MIAMSRRSQQRTKSPYAVAGIAQSFEHSFDSFDSQSQRKLQSRPTFKPLAVGAGAGRDRREYDSKQDTYMPAERRARSRALVERGQRRAKRQVEAERWRRVLGGTGHRGLSVTYTQGQSDRSLHGDESLLSLSTAPSAETLRRPSTRQRPHTSGGLGELPQPTAAAALGPVASEFISGRHSMGAGLHLGRSSGRYGGTQGGRTPLYTRAGLSASCTRGPSEGLPVEDAVVRVAAGWLSTVPEGPTDMGPGSQMRFLQARYFVLERTGVLSWSKAFDASHRPPTGTPGMPAKPPRTLASAQVLSWAAPARSPIAPTHAYL